MLAAFLTLLLAGASFAEDYRTARLSDVRGSVSLRGENEDDVSYVERNAVLREGDTIWSSEDGRAEIELELGSWIRLAEDTKMDVVRLGRDSEFRVWTGSIYVDVSDRMEGGLKLRTPTGDVEVDPDSVVRVDLSKESARVSVLNGRARVSAEKGEAVRLTSGLRLYLEADRPLAEAKTFDRDDRDGFDRYHRDRVDYFINRPLPRELDRYVLGAHDLNDYGSWIVYENTRYWRPRCEPDWRPYSSGYWNFVPGCGYTWVDYQPWGYTTSHYGRWLYRPTFGWLWATGYVWGPSYVYWSTYGNYCGWAPLDPWDRPCYYGSGSFFSLGFAIDFRSWTFCDRDRFYYGRHHRRFAGSGRTLISGLEVGLGHDRFRVVRNVHDDIGYPRDRVRGLTVGSGGVLARDRALRVENTIPASRLRRIENRFQIAGDRDRTRLGRGTDVDRVHRDPDRPIDQSRILRGDEALRRLGGFGSIGRIDNRGPGDRPTGPPARVDRRPDDDRTRGGSGGVLGRTGRDRGEGEGRERGDNGGSGRVIGERGGRPIERPIGPPTEVRDPRRDTDRGAGDNRDERFRRGTIIPVPSETVRPGIGSNPSPSQDGRPGYRDFLRPGASGSDRGGTTILRSDDRFRRDSLPGTSGDSRPSIGGTLPGRSGLGTPGGDSRPSYRDFGGRGSGAPTNDRGAPSPYRYGAPSGSDRGSSSRTYSPPSSGGGGSSRTYSPPSSGGSGHSRGSYGGGGGSGGGGSSRSESRGGGSSDRGSSGGSGRNLRR